MAAGDSGNSLAGVWRNPQNSVHVQIGSCGAVQCGVVVWANDKAKADARKSGTDPLVGVNLLRDLAGDGDGKWRAKVFLPEARATISGTIELLDANTFRAKSCVLGMVCKSQTWKRVG